MNGYYIDGYYRIIEIGKNIYRITSLENVYMELLVGENKALLIDTGYGFDNLKAVIDQITDKPLIIVNTHGHVDHTSGNQQFNQPVHISAKDMELCQKHNTKEIRIQSVKMAENTMDYATGKVVNGLPKEFDYNRYIQGDTGNLIPCNEGEIFDLGGMTIEVFETPGHTKGGLSYYYREAKYLYVGDEANPFCWLFDQDATDRATHIKSLEKIIQIGADQIFGAHMPQPVTVNEIRLYKQAAEQADFKIGVPFQTPIMPEVNARICILNGMTMEDMGKPGFASIVIDETR